MAEHQKVQQRSRLNRPHDGLSLCLIMIIILIAIIIVLIIIIRALIQLGA